MFVILGLMGIFGRALPAGAQQYPPGMDWLELSSPHFRVIFPRELYPEAQRTAATLEHVYGPVSRTMDAQPARLPLVLNNRSVVANGYVSLGPRRSVWQSTPFMPGSQSLLGTGEWFDLLAVHEFRHVAQYTRMNAGATRLARILFGQNGWAGSAAFAVPAWFWEGDAVGVETALTRSGRGRNPAFELHLRAMLREGRTYSYPKFRFRSYRDFVPGHYPYGYFMTTYVRRHFGATSWSRIVRRASSWSFVPLMFPLAVRYETGRGLHRVHREAMAELDLFWREQREGLSYSDGLRRNTATRVRWTNYAHPHHVGGRSLVVVQSGLREAADLVLLEPGSAPRRLGAVDPGLYFNGFDANGDFLVWSEQRAHPRFVSESYAELIRRDLDTGETHALTRRSRLFQPSIAPDGRLIAAVGFSRTRQSYLVVVDAESGGEVFRVATPGGHFLSEVSWTEDGGAVGCVLQNENGKYVAEFNLEDYSWRTVLPSTLENVWDLHYGAGYLFYVSDLTGIDNVYARDRASGAAYQVTSRPLGAYFPDVSPDGERLVFSDYTVDGFDVLEMDLDVRRWLPVDALRPQSPSYAQPLVDQESVEPLTPGSMRPSRDYPTRSYRRVRDAIRFHSWQPTYDGRAAGLALLSNNLLNTLAVQVGSVFDFREETLVGAASVVYSGWWPVVTMTGLYGGRTATFETGDGEEQSYSWMESGARLRLGLPLTFNRGQRTTSVNAAVTGGWFRISERDFVPFLEHGNGHLTPIGAALSVSRRSASAYSDFNPPHVESLTLAAQTTTGRSDFASKKLFGAAAIVFPGFSRQHRVRLVAEAELERPDNYRFSSILRFSRGYDYRYADNAMRATAEYVFPLAYPDFDVGNWLYVPRLIGTVFYDYTWTDRQNSGFSTTGTYQSAGAELMAEFYLLSIPVPLRLGVRAAYRVEREDYFVEPVVFSITF